MIHALQTPPVLIFAALVIAAAARDVVSFTIPNTLSVALIALFPVAAMAAGLPAAVWSLNVLAGAAALAVGMGLFAAGWLGGGDAKLLAVCALWLGWPAAVDFAAITALAGGGLALALLALRSAPARILTTCGPAWLGRLATPGESVPYGVAIAVGVLAALPGSAVAVHVAG